MERLVIALVIAGVAVAIALVVQRRRHPDAPSVPVHALPEQLDRADFDEPDAPWLVVLFGSDTCASCAAAWAEVQRLSKDGVAVQHVEAKDRADLHARYAIGAVPSIVVADRDGVVRSSMLGPPPAGHLRVVVADLTR